MLDKLKNLWTRWKVQVSVVGGVLIIATAYGQCTYEAPTVEANATTDGTTAETTGTTETTGTVEITETTETTGTTGVTGEVGSPAAELTTEETTKTTDSE